MKNNNQSFTRPSSPSSLNFSQAFELAKKQIEYDSFCSTGVSRSGNEIYGAPPLVDGLCRMIADVMRKPPEKFISIGGQMMPALMVQEIFAQLTRDHIEMVMEKYMALPYRVDKPLPYLTTSLYNSFFELDANYINQINADRWV